MAGKWLARSSSLPFFLLFFVCVCGGKWGRGGGADIIWSSESGRWLTTCSGTAFPSCVSAKLWNVEKKSQHFRIFFHFPFPPPFQKKKTSEKASRGNERIIIGALFRSNRYSFRCVRLQMPNELNRIKKRVETPVRNNFRTFYREWKSRFPWLFLPRWFSNASGGEQSKKKTELYYALRDAKE